MPPVISSKGSTVNIILLKLLSIIVVYYIASSVYCDIQVVSS